MVVVRLRLRGEAFESRRQATQSSWTPVDFELLSRTGKLDGKPVFPHGTAGSPNALKLSGERSGAERVRCNAVFGGRVMSGNMMKPAMQP